MCGARTFCKTGSKYDNDLLSFFLFLSDEGGGEDTNNPKSGLLSAHQQNKI